MDQIEAVIHSNFRRQTSMLLHLFGLPIAQNANGEAGTARSNQISVITSTFNKPGLGFRYTPARLWRAARGVEY
jgi:hypothetical protein